jgi:maltose alpha-D-glucosyltransferase/alpha-amylase
MQWDASVNAGFSSAPASQLYLPVEPGPERPNVAAQDKDPASLLNRVRRLIALRKAHPALSASGSFEVIHAKPGELPFVYRRSLGGESVLVGINPAARPAEVALPASALPGQPECLYGDPDALTRQGEQWLLRMGGVSACMFLNLGA